MKPRKNRLSIKKEPKGLYRTVYSVWIGRRRVGFVWSTVGFSYFGDQGWNRGIRLRDFHPVEWFFGNSLDVGTVTYSRRRGIERLLEAP